jgi:hypothetical protein
MSYCAKTAGSGRLRILGVSIFLLSVGFVLIPSAKAAKQTTWTITVDVTGGGSKPGYQVAFDPDYNHGGCIYAIPGVNAKKLVVCPGDIVKWKGNSTGNKHELDAFWSDDLFKDASGAAIFTLNATDGNPSQPGYVSSTATQLVYHEWYVALYDKKASAIRCDDPKIMVGTGQLDALSEAAKQLAIDTEKLEDLAQKNPQLNSDVKKQLDELAEIIRKIERAIPKQK